MIKKLYDTCVAWAGYKYAKQLLAIEAFIESSFFPIPPDVMIIPMVISKKKEFIKIALIATVFSVLGALFGYYIGYSLNEVAIKILKFMVMIIQIQLKKSLRLAEDFLLGWVY